MNTTKIILVRAALLLGLGLPAFWPTPAQAAPGAFDLSSPANGAWCTATCTFAWQPAASAASYDLYVDGAIKKAAIVAASSPSYTLAAGESIADGWHTWYSVARDSGGTTTQSASTWSVRVDSTPPAAFALLTPVNNSYAPSSPVTVAWSPSSDAGSGLDHYEIWVNGVAVTTAIPSSATSGVAPLPTATLFSDPIDSACTNWTFPQGSYWYCSKSYNDPVLTWGDGCCDYNRSGHLDLNSSIDLSNVGQATLNFLYMGTVGSSASYRARFSDDSGNTWSEVLTTPYGTYNSWTAASALLPMAGTATARLGFIAYDGTWTDSWTIHDVYVKGIVAQTYTWYVVAQDIAGNRTVSATWQIHYDLPSAPFDLVSPANGAWTANATPAFVWNATTDAGPGLAKYQVWTDGKLAIDNISATATTASPTSTLADGTHSWQVHAVDLAGAVRPSRETFSIGIDTTPPAAFSLYSPADQSTSTIPTPTLCWNATTDAGSGLDHYQLMIDGSLNRDGITDICSTPTATLTQGAHTWSVKVIDGVGNSRASTQTWTVSIDFNPPAGFVLLTPGNGITVDSPTPTFTWGASSDTASGLAHYELRIDSVCSACSITSTSTSYTLTAPLAAGTHTWSVTAVDGVAGSTVATGAPWTFTAQGIGPEPGVEPAPEPGPEPGLEPGPEVGPEPGSEPGLEPGPEAGSEPGPEPAPEPAHDAGVEAPVDVGNDTPWTTATNTSTNTSTLTATGTSTTTTTSTATGTSVGSEPRPDGSPVFGADAPILMADAAATSDAVTASDMAGARDALTADVLLGPADAWTATPVHDAATGSNIPDGGLASADASAFVASDAKVAASDGRLAAVDGSGYDAGAVNKRGSSGCGCAVGGHDARATWGLPLIVLGLLAFRRGSRPQMRGPRNG